MTDDTNHSPGSDDYETLLEAARNESDDDALALKLMMRLGLRPHTTTNIAQTVSSEDTFENDNRTQ
jgi:hypothetical protein